MSYGQYVSQQYPEEITATTKLFAALGYDDDHPKVQRFLACRQRAWFTRNEETGKVRIRSMTCGDRWCPMCAATRRITIANNVRDWVRAVPGPKLLTLTLKHRTSELRDQIGDLYRYFTTIRRNPKWKRHIRGGVWFVHVTWRDTAQQWQPHLHCVIDADWWEQRHISKLWGAVTHDSYIVDVRAIHSTAKVANYVARDAAKPMSLAQLPDDRLIEAHSAFYGRRMAGVWGSARAAHLLLTPNRPEGTWKTLGTWATVTEFAEHDRSAREILIAWQTGVSLPPDIDVRHLENEYGELGPSLLPDPQPNQLHFEGFT